MFGKKMGLIFKRQAPGRKMAFERRVADSQISNKYIRGVVKEVGSKFVLGKTEAKKRFAKDLFNKTLTRENVHEALEKRIQAGDISMGNAKKIQTELGVTEERFKKFNKHAAKEISTKENQQIGDRSIGRSKVPADRLETLKNNRKTIAKETQKDQKMSETNFHAPARSVDISNPYDNIPEKKMTGTSKEHSSVWEILNKKQHSDAFPDNDQKAA